MYVSGERSHEEVGVLVRIAHEALHHPSPRRRNRLRERDEVERAEDVHRRRPVVGQARHAGEHREAAVRAAEHADPVPIDPVLGMQPLDGMVPVLHVAAAPVALYEPLIRLAVARRAADVRRQHSDAAADEVLVQRVVLRVLLRLGAAVDREHDRDTSLDGRAIQPRRDLAIVERRVRDQLEVGELVLGWYADPALRDCARAARPGLHHPGLRGTPRPRQDDGGTRPVVRECDRRTEAREMRPRAAPGSREREGLCRTPGRGASGQPSRPR